MDMLSPLGRHPRGNPFRYTIPRIALIAVFGFKALSQCGKRLIATSANVVEARP